MPVSDGDTLTLGRPHALFEGPYMSDPNGLGIPNYDVSPDGQTFYMIVSHTEDGSATRDPFEINVVLNWTQELLERVPINSARTHK